MGETSRSTQQELAHADSSSTVYTYIGHHIYCHWWADDEHIFAAACSDVMLPSIGPTLLRL